METTKTNNSGKGRILIIAGLLAALVLGAAGGWWYYSSSRVSTDDARIKGTIVPVSSKIQARITEVLVENGSQVEPGTILAKLDSSELDAQLLQAKANLAAAQAKLAAAQAGNRPQQVAQASASANETNASLDNAQKNYERIAALYNQGAVSAQEFDTAQTTLNVAKAKNDSATQSYSLSAEGTRSEDIAYAEAEVAQAQAAVKNLEAQIDNTVIRASEKGFIDAKAAEVGQVAVPGMTLFNIVALDDVWVSANVEETYIGKIKVNDTAEVDVDAYPGIKFKGHVIEVGSAAGSQFSLLPAENTSGNFTKVTQRFEVKIKVDPNENYVLKPGMSAVITIHV
jgi:membrane fusion protein (multidrug efflux system)